MYKHSRECNQPEEIIRKLSKLQDSPWYLIPRVYAEHHVTLLMEVRSRRDIWWKLIEPQNRDASCDNFCDCERMDHPGCCGGTNSPSVNRCCLKTNHKSEIPERFIIHICVKLADISTFVH